MSGKKEKKLRKIVKNAYNEQMQEMQARQIFEAYRAKINGYPLKIRVKIALNIMRGKF